MLCFFQNLLIRTHLFCQFDSVVHCSTAGACHYDESESPGRKRQGTGQERLHDQSQIGIRDQNAHEKIDHLNIHQQHELIESQKCRLK